MNPYVPESKKRFIGRSHELKKLTEISQLGEAAIVIVYGRRRVGKTELLEYAYGGRGLLKFEGVEGLPEIEQIKRAVRQLAVYSEDPLLNSLELKDWGAFFLLLNRYISKGKYTLYLEELQWLTNYSGQLASELKFAWDNYFRHNPDLIIVLCGSSPSFMIDQVAHSRGLYNRSQHEIHLREFSLAEAQEFLKSRSQREVVDAYLTVGGVPEYLKWVDQDSSVRLSICKNAFTPESFFSCEYDRIFTSSMAGNKYYRAIVEFLAKRRYASRNEILAGLKIASGGTLTRLLEDLEKSGLIQEYSPVMAPETTTLRRYAIADNYLQFYFKFIKPVSKAIKNADFIEDPVSALNQEGYARWLGFAFERWCRKNHRLVAKYLGFSGVKYQSGAYFSRKKEEHGTGLQIDLVFNRADHVVTICEIKYLQGLVGPKVIQEMANKLELFPVEKKQSIQKVLICNEGIDNALEKRCYFDKVILLEELLNI